MGYFKNIIDNESKKDYYINLKKFVDAEYENKTIYPEKKNIYAALEKTPYENVKVVILGQDPYHGENEAHGFCFSVKDNVKRPPSLNNILKNIDNYDDMFYYLSSGFTIVLVNGFNKLYEASIVAKQLSEALPSSLPIHLTSTNSVSSLFSKKLNTSSNCLT